MSPKSNIASSALIRSSTFVLLLLLITSATFSQEDSIGFLLKSGLNDIKELKPDTKGEEKITVAGLFESNIYEAPGVISVITEEDIKENGYHDLMDLLNQIPGFSIASDVQNGLSFGIRGNWAEEAKLLVMIDGMPLNEMAYGTYVFGQRGNLINVKKIEIIRGSGSSQYGGTGGLGVINIVTKGGQELSGHRLMGAGGLSRLKGSRGNIAYNYGGLLPNDVEITTMGSIGQGNLSNEVLHFEDSTSAYLADSSKIRGAQFHIVVKYKGYIFRDYYEDYSFQSTYEPIFSVSRNSLTELEKVVPLKRVNYSFKINFRDQIPWNTQYGDPKIYDAQNLVTQRLTGSFRTTTKIKAPIQFLVGLDAYRDNVKHQRARLTLQNGSYKEIFYGISAFAELNYINRYVNVVAGYRFEQYAYFKPNLAPRISITKKFKWWNYKLIYNQAYKLPALQNINLDVNGTMEPERITEFQTQIGYQSKKLNLNATYFNTAINKLIIYGYNTISFEESYVNSGDLQNHGFEFEGAYTHKNLKLSASYSNNFLIRSTVSETRVDTLKGRLGQLAMPTHKVIAKLSLRLKPNYYFNMQYVFETSKCTYVRVNTQTSAYALRKFPATNNVNLVFNADNLYKNILDISLGCYNVLGTELTYLYPFNSGYQSLVGMGREFMLCFKFKL